MAPSDERELVARANQGDAAAFEELYRRHRDWVVGLAWRFVGNRDDALDVLQETFAALFDRFPGFALTSSLRGYLYPVVKHRCISLLRKRRRVVAIDEARTARGDLAGELAWQPDPPGEFAEIISALPAEQREVVRLRFALDLKLEEIAQALAIPTGTVKSRLHNALKVLLKVV
ncbi:MAG: RNA polymerase sigma factor [Deltaproteobacteria bacterium]|nr:RNA polymerase sigma factor [Deltaproteobacteria bacterium]